MISYDLNEDEKPQACAAVRKFIKKNADSWTRPLKSQWFVDTDMDPDWWTDQLTALMDDNDRFFVCRIYSESYQGYLTDKMWNWLDKHLDWAATAKVGDVLYHAALAHVWRRAPFFSAGSDQRPSW
jgi:hypothetical protein